jgi:hypothetical protein
MNHINAIVHQPGFARSECAWIGVDGKPIEKWFAEEFDNPDATTLGLAQVWLHNEDEERLAWSRIVPGLENSSTIVPILVCSDDMDFACTVLVVEQLVTNGTVQWVRWGYSVSSNTEVGISTEWVRPTKAPLATFDRNEFEDCLRSFGQKIPVQT